MSKTETNEFRGDFNSLESEPRRSFFQPKTKSHRWVHTQPDLTKSCLLCDSQIQVKYILPKKQYSRKNNWGYWTGKEAFRNKYACNSCLLKLYQGNINGWIPNQTKADIFYNYVKRGQF